MSDYNNPLYKFVLDENELLPVFRAAAAHGLQSYVIINGLHYRVKIDAAPAPASNELPF